MADVYREVGFRVQELSKHGSARTAVKLYDRESGRPLANIMSITLNYPADDAVTATVTFLVSHLEVESENND